ncbi:hypothetical protein CKO_01349 [Citrobacter koseri ATCC BAA-895]|uniref:Uncharacterized protein n=1 Tax=Citrobacter koseri (strain ATCC BAA-895 / CDC 4225-83 / SGSC4696) TaxID=290338 RepID=A8AG73_CITK8|nr:hypothetical protein CKO_01349 [Citrobacter koseri ATCC BAA-895]
MALTLTGPTDCFVGRIRSPVALMLTGPADCFVGRIRRSRHPAKPFLR